MTLVVISVGVAPVSTVPEPETAGQTVRVVVRALDADTQQLVAVTGLRLMVRQPMSPVPLSYAQEQLDEVEPGHWTLDLVLDVPGRWRLRVECEGPRPAVREIGVSAGVSGLLSTEPLGALLVTPEGDPIATPDARSLTAQRIDRMREFGAGELAGLRLVGARDAEGGQVSYDTLRQDVSSTAASAGASAAATLSWDRLSLRTWMEGQGYVWNGGADAAPLINTLLAQTVEGGAMSGRAIVCPPGLLPCLSPLRIPDYARNLALIGDGNFRLEKRFAGDFIINQAGTGAVANASGQRPRGVYLSGLEIGAAYTPHATIRDFAATSSLYSGSSIYLIADQVRMSDLRLWGLGPGGRFLQPAGGDWQVDGLDIRYGQHSVGQGGIRIVWSDNDMSFRRVYCVCGDDALQPVCNDTANRSILGTILFEDCTGISAFAHGACVYAGTPVSGSIATQSTSVEHVIYRRCRLLGALKDAYLVTRGTTGSIGLVEFDNCDLEGPGDGIETWGTDDLNSAVVANIIVDLTRHRGQPSYGALRSLRIANSRIGGRRAAGILTVQRDGLGERSTNGVVLPSGTLQYYSGQANTTPIASVTVASDVAALPFAGDLLIQDTIWETPQAWRGPGLELDGVTPRPSGAVLATSVSGTTNVLLGFADARYWHPATGWPGSGMKALFTLAGASAGPMTIRVDPDDTARPLYRADRVTPATSGDVPVNANGLSGVTFETLTENIVDAVWRVMTTAEIDAVLTPSGPDAPLIAAYGFRQVTLRGGEFNVAPGQHGVRIGGGDLSGSNIGTGSGGRHLIDGGVIGGLDVAPLYGAGPGSPAAWSAQVTPSQVRGVWGDNRVRHLLITGGHRIAPAQTVPSAQIVPYLLDNPAGSVTRGVRACLVHNAQLVDWPANWTYFSGSGWTVGDGVQYPAGWVGTSTAVPSGHPGYVASFYYPLWAGAVTDTIVGAGNRLYLLQFELDRDLTISELEMYVSVAGAAGSAAKLGIWRTGAGARPGLTPLVSYDAGIDCSSPGVKTASVATALLPAKTPLWACAIYTSPGTLPTVRGPSPATQHGPARVGAANLATLFPTNAAVQIGGLYVDLPYATALASLNLAGSAWVLAQSGIGGLAALTAKAA